MSKRPFDFGVFVGRFQPLHVGHTHIIDEALSQVDTLIVVIGSSTSARTVKNPFTFAERRHVIEQAYRHECATGRLMIVGVGDDAADDRAWAMQVRGQVELCISHKLTHHGTNLEGLKDQKIALAGYGKDASSFYLDMFPDWGNIQIEAQKGTLNSTDIRGVYFQALPAIPADVLPQSSANFLDTFRWLPEFQQLMLEWRYYANYAAEWGKGPFLTGDTIVWHRNQVLLVTRGKIPGKGMLALPGGFRNPREPLQDACVRELREETGLDLNTAKHRYVAEFDVDTPGRSLRGDVITHVLCVELPNDFDRSTLTASDDAQDLGWFDFEDLTPDQMFDDHWSIIRTLIENHR